MRKKTKDTTTREMLCKSVTVADLTVSHDAHIKTIDYACNWDDQVRKTTLNPYTFFCPKRSQPPRLHIPDQKVMFFFGA